MASGLLLVNQWGSHGAYKKSALELKRIAGADKAKTETVGAAKNGLLCHDDATEPPNL
jgi:hypothetical protein